MEFEINNCINIISHIHSVSADFTQKKLAEKGFTNFASSHGNILFQLSRVDSMQMSELAEKINRDKSTTTVLVRKLEQDNLVKTSASENDKRIKTVFLTEKGKQYNQITGSISSELLKTFYKDFSDSDKAELVRLLEKINSNFKCCEQN